MYMTPLQDTEAHKFLREWREINMGAEMTAKSLTPVGVNKDISPDEVARGGGVISEHEI